MDIIFTHVITKEDAENMIKKTEDIQVFLMEAVLTDLNITATECEGKNVIRNILIYYKIKETDSMYDYTEYWYNISGALVPDLKDFFQTKAFITYYGRMCSAAMRALGINVNIIKDFYNKKANKDSSKSNYMNKLIYRVENFENEYTDGAVEIEYGNEIYFGIQVDEAELNRQLQMISELIESKKEILVNKLGSTRLKGNNEMTEKFNELGIRVNRLSGKCIRDAMRKYGTESEKYKLLKEYSEYRSAEKNWSYLRNIRDSIKQGRVRMANMPGTLGMETAGYAVEHDLLKPTDGYTIIQISTERAAVFNLMNRLSMNPVEEPVDWFKHIAAKAFNVDDITNLSEEQRGTARDIMISLGYKDVERILNDKILYSERELTFKQNVKDVIKALKQKSFIGAITDLRMTNLSREVKNILKTMGETNAYNVCKNIVNIDKALTNHIILKVRKYFGATNLRVRLVGEYYGYLLYEIANDSVDEFKNFISCDIINLGDKRLNVEINKVIEEV